MHEKNLSISEYLDLYGDILDDRQHQIMDMYYNEDYSLSEISEILGITRQGVGESIRKTTKKLIQMEEKLHFKSRIASFEKEKVRLADKVRLIASDGCKSDVTLQEIICDINNLGI